MLKIASCIQLFNNIKSFWEAIAILAQIILIVGIDVALGRY
ncbi:hypothetical protein [Nostoc sp. KVJ3]|nr:hypothetical protein [Nostoc sp. KVJ3]